MKKMGGSMSGAAARTGSLKAYVNKKYYKKIEVVFNKNLNKCR